MLTPPAAMPANDAYAALMRQQAMDAVKRLGLAMAGVGAGWRGLEGLVNLSRRNIKPRPPSLMQEHYVDVPVPRRDKQADDGWLSQTLQGVAKPFSDSWQGRVSHPSRIPWFPLAAAGVGAGGLYGGYKLTDMLLDKRRQADLDRELEESRREYELALRGGSKLATELDRLCDEAEKRAWISPDLAGPTAGTAMTLLGALSLGSGLLAYDITKGRQPADVLREAKRRQARARLRKMPPPIYARVSGTDVPSEEEQMGEPLDKAADALVA